MDNAKWKETKLGSILRYIDDPTVMHDDKEYLTITVRRRHGGLEIREKLFGHQIATKKQFPLVSGAFIISRIQCWHQAYAMVGDVPPNAIASTNYDQFEIDPQVSARFFWWLSHSPAFTETVRASAAGVVIEKMVFNRYEWLEKSVLLPPLAEQRKIAARIDELAVQIQEAQELRDLAIDEVEALVISNHMRLSGSRKRRLGEILRLEEDAVPIRPAGSYPQVGVRSFGGGLFPKAATTGTETTYRAFTAPRHWAKKRRNRTDRNSQPSQFFSGHGTTSLPGDI
jgi:type I restriction enzyme S subunit